MLSEDDKKTVLNTRIKDLNLSRSTNNTFTFT